MAPRQLKIGYFVLEGLNSFGTVFYIYYFYFFTRKVFGFSDQANLELAALNGCVTMFASWWGGRFAQRFGFSGALKLGLILMLMALAIGAFLNSVAGQILVMVVVALGMCFTWPTLEAILCEDETRAGLQRVVGIFNVVWAGTAAVADFAGGAMLEKLGLRSIFYVPAAIVLGELALILWLANRAGIPPLSSAASLVKDQGRHGRYPTIPRPIAQPRLFRRMAWLANPFAYVAINTLVAVIPGVAKRLDLSTMAAGFCCSVWCFARLGSFFAFWLWTGWHYRFRWLVTAYAALVLTFGIIVLAPNLMILVLAQMIFGCALGLIYYSSLFYSMDLSDTKGTHGGIHEAAIGLGNFAGPALGAASLHFLPQHPSSGAVAVNLLLLLGLGGLVAVWAKGRGAVSNQE